MVNENNHGSCLTELIDRRFGRIAVRECRRRVESCLELDGVAGRSCRTDVLDVSSSVSDRVFVAAVLFCTGRCCTGAVTFALGSWDTVGVPARVRDAILLTPSVEPVSRQITSLNLVSRRCRCWVVVGRWSVRPRASPRLPDASRRLDSPVPVHVFTLHFHFFHVCFFLGNFVA